MGTFPDRNLLTRQSSGRLPLTSLIVLLGAVFAAGCDPGINLEIRNQTDSDVCWYESLAHKVCTLIPANKTTEWTTFCTGDEDQVVILKVVATTEVIYSRTATCREWEDSGAWVEVRQEGKRFVVEDSLSDGP